MLNPWQWTIVCTPFALLIAGYAYERIGASRDARMNPAPGRMVRVGKHRLHLLCQGSGAPSVVIEPGAGEPARFWRGIQEEAAKFATVCSYDRAGFGWSECASAGRTIDERAAELHGLLTNADIPGPYLFVAHSYGGFIVRSFAQMYPRMVAGLVLVDTPDESCLFQREVLEFYAKVRVMNRIAAKAAQFGVLRLLRRWVPLERYGFWLSRAGEYEALCDELASLERVPHSDRTSKAAGSLGDLPVTVITHGVPFPGPFAVLEKNWNEGQQRLAALSTESQLIVGQKSNHMVQQDEPDLVVAAIQRMHACSSAG